MKARSYRPKVQNGTISKRQRSSAKSARPAAARGRRRKNRREGPEEGSNLFLTLVMVGALVVMGFVFALRSQLNTRQLGQAEERLKSELDQIADQQRFDVLEQQRTTSLRESARAAQESGLVQPGSNPKSQPPGPIPQPPGPDPEPQAEAPEAPEDMDEARISPVEIPRPANSRAARPKKENYNSRQSDRLAQRR